MKTTLFIWVINKLIWIVEFWNGGLTHDEESSFRDDLIIILVKVGRTQSQAEYIVSEAYK